MPTPPTIDLVGTVRERIGRIRRAWNLLELQRALYLLVAAGLGNATLLLLLALFGSTALFAVAVWSSAAALAVTLVLVARELRGRWLPAARAVAWIEQRAALEGRLRTIVELHARGVTTSEALFLPLLAAENRARLVRWTRRRLVPRRVPRAALAAAFGGVALLLVTLALTPVMYPRVPEVLRAATPDAWTDGGASAEAGGRPGAPGSVQGGADGGPSEQAMLARLPAAVQEEIRRHVWGDAWDRVHDALAQGAAARHRGAASPSDDDFGDDGVEPWALAEAPGSAGDAGGRQAPAAGDPRPRSDAAAGPASRPAGDDPGTGASIEAAAGAGNTTDPHLFGPSLDADERASRERFELALATRVRAARDSAGAAGGEAPPAEPDARPALAPVERREVVAHEMPVPRVYEAIVRQVFAHQDLGEDATQ